MLNYEWMPLVLYHDDLSVKSKSKQPLSGTATLAYWCYDQVDLNMDDFKNAKNWLKPPT